MTKFFPDKVFCFLIDFLNSVLTMTFWTDFWERDKTVAPKLLMVRCILLISCPPKWRNRTKEIGKEIEKHVLIRKKNSLEFLLFWRSLILPPETRRDAHFTGCATTFHLAVFLNKISMCDLLSFFRSVTLLKRLC